MYAGSLPTEAVRETAIDYLTVEVLRHICRNGHRITISGLNLVVERPSQSHFATHLDCNPEMKQHIQLPEMKGSCDVDLPYRGKVAATFTRSPLPTASTSTLPTFALTEDGIPVLLGFTGWKLDMVFLKPRYSVTRTITIPYFTPILWILAILRVGIVTLLNIAVVGYDMKRFTLNPSRILTNFDMTSSPSQSPSFHSAGIVPPHK
jgi:hypothetical protein